MIVISLFLFISISINSVYTSHFRGGSISWRPATNQISVLNTQRSIIISQRYTWSKSAPASACTSATIVAFGLIGENSVSVVKCESPLATCTSAPFTNISTFVPCTDYNTVIGMSFGQSSTAVNLTVHSTGIVLGYVVGGAWLTLQLGGGGWSLMTYLNLQPRPDNALINSSPTSDIPSIVYVPADSNLTTAIDIPMYDADGDEIQCRFAQSSNILGGVTVNECSGVCSPVALPASTQLISGNNTCILMVTLPAIGYYAVAIQLEDFIENTTTALSSVPLQFLILTYDASNPTSTCTLAPIITSIPPDYPLPGDTIAVQVTVLYTAMVVAQTGCANDTDTSIVNFITTSPPGMVKTNLPFALASPSFGINLTWTPTIDQLGQTFTFCAVAIDSNYYSSSQYCFYLYVGPKTTTTTTTTTSSTSTSSSTTSTSTTTTSVTTTTTTTTTTITTTATPFNCLPLELGLGLGFGLPLLLLLSLLALAYLCRWCPPPLRSIIRYRYGQRDDMFCPHCQSSLLYDDPGKLSELRCVTPEGTRRYRQQYLNTNDEQRLSRQTTSYLERQYLSSRASFLSGSGSSAFGPRTTTVTSFLSPSTINLPTETVSRVLSPPCPEIQHQGSILVRAFSKQVQPI